MRLKSINVFSDYLGDLDKTHERTGELRNDSYFLDYVFDTKTKYVNNAYLKQLNICCSPVAEDIFVRMDYPEGYPEIVIPFDYSLYEEMSENEKDSFWIDTVEKVLAFLEPRMKCEDDKIKQYIQCLRESDIRVYKKRVNEILGVWNIVQNR